MIPHFQTQTFTQSFEKKSFPFEETGCTSKPDEQLQLVSLPVFTTFAAFSCKTATGKRLFAPKVCFNVAKICKKKKNSGRTF